MAAFRWTRGINAIGFGQESYTQTCAGTHNGFAGSGLFGQLTVSVFQLSDLLGIGDIQSGNTITNRQEIVDNKGFLSGFGFNGRTVHIPAAVGQGAYVVGHRTCSADAAHGGF